MSYQIYTYGIIDSTDRLEESINGVEGAGIHNIPYRDIGLVASDFIPYTKIFDRRVNLDCVLKHLKIIERLMEKFTVLPVRYLTVFNRKEDVLSMMEDYYNDFRENLDRVRNKVEFGLKVIWPGDAITKRITNVHNQDVPNALLLANSPAITFLKEKLGKRRIEECFEEEANRCIAVVDNFLSKFAVEKKLEKLKSKNLLLNASYLAEKEKQDSFKQAFIQLRAAQGSFKYLFSGPWPPYNFISLSYRSSHHNLGVTDMFNRLVKPLI